MALSVTYPILQRFLARKLGWDRTPANWSTNQLLDGPDIINAGLRLFYDAYPWSFLREVTPIDTVAAYDTGTITIAAGVVTLSGGTFPSGAADYDLIAHSGTYSVATRDGNTQITLDDTSVTDATARAYTLAKTVYDLPATFGGMDGPLTYLPGQLNCGGALKQRDELYIRQRRQQLDGTGSPDCFAIRPKTFDATAGQLWQILFFPLPQAVYHLQARTRIQPESLSDSNLYPRGGGQHGQSIIAAVLAAAEATLDGGPGGPEFSNFQVQLQRSISIDRGYSPEVLGYNGDNSDPTQSHDGAVLAGPWPVGYTGYSL